MITSPFKDWKYVINTKILYEIIENLNFLYSKGFIITPEKKDIFKCFTTCPYKDLKVVMIGLDPYPQKGIATGIMFGNKRGTQVLSPSLNIIKEALFNPEENVLWPNDKTVDYLSNNFDITLESWSQQGVLLLNSALTCLVNNSESHVDLWRPFIKDLVTELNKQKEGLVYVLFGSVAKTLETYINHNKNLVLKEHHPALFARYTQSMTDYVFKETNKYLKAQYNEHIDFYGIKT